MPDDCKHCPETAELDRLVHDDLPPGRAEAVTDHVGRCPGCQDRMEDLAAGGDDRLTGFLHRLDPGLPPAGSAFWPALSAAEAEVAATTLLPADRTADGRPSGEVPLTFLRPAAAPGALGTIGIFDIVSVIGRGGMGVVLRGRDPHLDRDVAVKVLDPQLANNQVAKQRFCREARAAAAVTHDNLVAVHQVDDDDSGLPYLVMQLVVGESLDQRLKRAGRMTPGEVARLGQQAAAGLSAAHAGGLIHRDIKPGNILIEAGTDRVKLTDFGLARAAEDVKLTRTGYVAGTPLYMAPEQARGEEIDARADLFSLGSVLYEAATGKPPFDGTTPLAVLRRVADETQPPLKQVVPDTPQWLSDVIDRLLAKDPAHRFQTAQEVADIFATELARSQVFAEQAAGPCGKSRSVYALRRPGICWREVLGKALLFVGGGIIGGLATWLLVHEPPAEVASPPAASAPVPPDPGPAPRVVVPGTGGPVWAVAFGPKGDAVVAGAEDGSIRLFHPESGKVFKTLPRLGGNVWAVDVSADGEDLLAVSDNGEVRGYSMATFNPGRLYAVEAVVKAAAFSPDGRFLATGDRSGSVRVWDRFTGIPAADFDHKGTVHALAFGPGGQRLATAGSDGVVRVWDLTAPKDKPVELAQHEGPVYGVAFSPDGAEPRVATAGWDGTVRVWDPRNGVLKHTLRGHSGDVWGVSFGHGGAVVASAGADGTVRVWDVATGEEREVFRGERPFHAVRFGPDGTTLAAGSRDGTVRVWDVK
ncbi:MAG: serine/threonine protein kinase [Gemmataceae bacterium]|nr:serine/threonine protein kinase [Gemmataceae bacterium]